jgi:hypothetical protein
VFVVGPVGGVFWVGGVLVPLVMELPLKVACSEVAIALGGAAYLSAGFSTEVGVALGAFLGVWVAAFGGWCGWWFWGFCFLPRLICWRRDLRVALRGRLVDGGGGWRFSLRRGRGGGLWVFSSVLVVAVVSAVLGCRDWRLALPAAALFALFLAALAAG